MTDKLKEHSHSLHFIAKVISDKSGAQWYLAGIIAVIVGACFGPFLNYSRYWELAFTTGTTIIAFALLFLVQKSQYHDTRVVQIKLDELLRATEGAHTALLCLEHITPEELHSFQAEYKEIAVTARERLHQGKSDTNIPPVELGGFLS